MSSSDESGLRAHQVGSLSSDAEKLYLRALQSEGRLVSSHCAEDPDSPEGRALRELQAMGLLVPDTEQQGVLVAVDPRQLAVSLSASWQREALDLLSRSVALPDELHQLSEAYEAISRHSQSGGAIEYVRGTVEINQRLLLLSRDSSREVLTAQPGGGRRQRTMAAARDRDSEVLRRGVSRRTIYQPSARYSAPTRQYADSMTRAGGEVRTLNEPFLRLMIFDQRVGVIPVTGGAPNDAAAFIEDEAVVGYLVNVFESLWERAIPFLGTVQVPPQVVSGLRQQILRFMAQGVGHRVIARRLGLSERTLARHIAEMREEYGVETLFQLGWKAAQSNWRITEDGPDDSL
ncbi:helix-turn-helix domain-containing protein [Peterkaempfera bronchialis]|uniref:Uncharacterized protein n=1 Tax=Peterkaempfera bronchialis TaxID=2126346 RepID=A0A345SXI8_9ACTN|nr:helix-turn-helix domain-containing protein [Peterkaempfera bronchialis]AXI78443.1 hypothetical protein C7M71_014380 [Peterkaempfera bronchialis]